MDCVQGRKLGARASPSEVYPAGNTLLVVSILDIVYDCYLWRSPEGTDQLIISNTIVVAEANPKTMLADLQKLKTLEYGKIDHATL